MAEEVISRSGRFEVDARRMVKYVRQQDINDAEIDRIVEAREKYIEWMHHHFADRVLPPREDVQDPADAS